MSVQFPTSEDATAGPLSDLDWPRGEFLRVVARLADSLFDELEHSADSPAIPCTSATQLRAKVFEGLPEGPCDNDDMLDRFRSVVIANAARTFGPKFNTYVMQCGTMQGAIADLVVSFLNQNACKWHLAPLSAELERITVRWLSEFLGLPEQFDGVLVSGASAATIIALAAMRSRALPQCAQQGLYNARPLRTYASDQTHSCVARALRILGLGADSLVLIPSTPRFTIDVEALRTQLQHDSRAGCLPACVIANAGTTNTGAVDPIDALADVCEDWRLWLHVDGAYGGPAAAVPGFTKLFAGWDRADSIGIDPHKWLYCPYDVGTLLVRDLKQVRTAMSLVPEYLRYDTGIDSERRDAYEYKTDLSARCRATKLWATFKWIGAAALRAAIERNISDAHWLADCIDRSERFELMTAPVLSVVCFRFLPPHAPPDSNLDQAQTNLVEFLEREGQIALTATTLKGVVALRWCITNHRTQRKHLEEQLDRLLIAAQALSSDHRTSC